MQLAYFEAIVPNFGDDLNIDIWPRLAPELFEVPDRTGFLGIGTIAGMPTPDCDFIHVFSSGVGYSDVADWKTRRNIVCLRGPLSATLLGAPEEAALTDGAILAPLVLPDLAQYRRRADVGVMPHWQSIETADWLAACQQAGMRLITPIDSPIRVQKQLSQCRLLLTESLHGAIFADTFGIPWIPFASTSNFSVFKWTDWCLSLRIEPAVTLLPPPSLKPLLAFGRPQLPWGHQISLTPDVAMEDYRAKACHSKARAPRSLSQFVRSGIKHALRGGPELGGFLGLSDQRTANALKALAEREPILSDRDRLRRLQTEMLDRLRRLSASHGSEP